MLLISYFSLLSLSILSQLVSHGVRSAAVTRRQAPNPNAKAGLDWNNPTSFDPSTLISSKVGWYYTWSPWSLPNVSLDFVPMFWGVSQLGNFQAQITPQSIIQHGIGSILGMNEPDQPGQSNLDAGTAAMQWKTYLEPFKTSNPSIRLGSPATTNAPNGRQWMYDFFGACGGGCSVDFVALHWYGLDNATDFIAHATDYHNAFGRPIWVTEWGCQNFGDQSMGQCSQDQITEFLNATQSWMDQTDFIERYAWLGVTANVQGVNPENNLLNSDGTINDLGKQYLGEVQSSAGGSGNSTSSSNGNSTSSGGSDSGNGGDGVIIISGALRNAAVPTWMLFASIASLLVGG